jgi:hypothetical protein
LESEVGALAYNAEKADRFKEFVQRAFANANTIKSKRVLPWWLCAPKLIWTFSSDEELAIRDAKSRVTSVEVTQVFTGFWDGEFNEIDRRSVCTVPIEK